MSFMWGIVGINDIHCHLLLDESKGQGVQRLACQTLVSRMLRVSPLAYKGETSLFRKERFFLKKKKNQK